MHVTVVPRLQTLGRFQGLLDVCLPRCVAKPLNILDIHRHAANQWSVLSNSLGCHQVKRWKSIARTVLKFKTDRTSKKCDSFGWIIPIRKTRRRPQLFVHRSRPSSALLEHHLTRHRCHSRQPRAYPTHHGRLSGGSHRRCSIGGLPLDDTQVYTPQTCQVAQSITSSPISRGRHITQSA